MCRTSLAVRLFAFSLLLAIVASSPLSAHRRDEYLQAARIGIASDHVDLQLDLTPGIAVAEAVIADIDRNHDGRVTSAEVGAYADRVMREIALDIDGLATAPARLSAMSVPELEALKRGEGTVALQATFRVPHLDAGVHRLSFRNAHQRDISVYLANALVPTDDRVTIQRQHRDVDQRDLEIEYDLHRGGVSASTRDWGVATLIGVVAVLMLLARLQDRRTRARVLRAVGTAALLLIVIARPAGAQQRPNIIYIMSDDHAAHAIGAYGSKVNETPNLDRLAREGAVFTNVFVTNSICTPSRAVILTGQYSHLNGVTVFNRFDSSRMTVAKLLQAGGYYTGMIGKWHLGSDPQGFDHWEILPGQGVYVNPVFYTATSQKTYDGYATDIITQLGIEFLEQRPKDKPFFLMLHHKAPHRPWQPDSAHGARFAGKWISEPETFWDGYETRTDALHENQQRIANDLTRRDLKLQPPADLDPAARNAWLAVKPDRVTTMIEGKSVELTGEALTRWKYQHFMQDYLATVQSVDDSVGLVLQALDRLKIARNTIVIYTSDQGFFLGDHGLFDKRFMYEESLRMPFLVRWPAVVKPGSRIDAMALNVDFAPTFLDAAGLSVPSEMQGRSLLPLLRGRKPADWRTSMYYRYYHDPGDHNTRAHYGVRTMTHKLIYYWKKDQWELFDLVHDPYELHNLYGQPGQEAITATLKAELRRLKREVKDDDQLANEQLPDGVDGPVEKLRGK